MNTRPFPLALPAAPVPAFHNTAPNVAQGYIQNFYNGQYVVPEPVPAADLEAAFDRNFIEPAGPEQWESARKALRQHGIIVLNGPVGSGLRTAALRLLRLELPSGSPLTYLEPDWSKPQIKALPRKTGEGCVLNMSLRSPEPPDESFGRNLTEYGRQQLGDGQLTIVLTTPEVWEGMTASDTQALTFRFGPPDARTLVTRELRRRGASDRVDWLSEPSFGKVWASGPRPDDALRLARMISDMEHRDSLQDVLDEFTGWSHYIEDTLLYPAEVTHKPDVLTTRTVVWSAALLDGGTPRAVISSSDLLLKELGVSRDPKDIAQDATAPKKLKAARITTEGDHFVLDSTRSSLNMAVLRHLFGEFSGIRGPVLKWVKALLGSTSLPRQDVGLAVDRVVALAAEGSDNELLKTVHTGLTGTRRALAVQALTTAALDPEQGAYVRNQLYRWVRGKANGEVLSLVAEICGGELGMQRPDIALTRLRLVAEHAPSDCPELDRALSQLAETHPTEVIKAVHTWLDDAELRNAGRRAFLALADSAQGRTLILGENGERLNAPEERARLVRVWRMAVKDQDLDSPVGRALLKWGELMDSGGLPSGTDYLLAEVLEPSLSLLAMELFGAPAPAWQRVRTAAMIIRENKKSAGAVE
ncbi:hypothetical protein ABZ512_08805 [Nocardiopsis dassonvillei]|uniref:hypothetical protein n=1 Tax=Nocardiopsis dassonvillei TaxID=2014 RepID=UPI0033D09B0E